MAARRIKTALRRKSVASHALVFPYNGNSRSKQMLPRKESAVGSPTQPLNGKNSALSALPDAPERKVSVFAKRIAQFHQKHCVTHSALHDLTCTRAVSSAPCCSATAPVNQVGRLPRGRAKAPCDAHTAAFRLCSTDSGAGFLAPRRHRYGQGHVWGGVPYSGLGIRGCGSR